MEDFDALEDPHYNSFPLRAKPTSRRRAGGSNLICSNFLFRLLFVALFLSVLPLFTSEPPDFISNSVFAKSWELVHLFIIGIIVSYGLFGRRGTQTLTPPACNSPNNMLHASTIFNFDHQNPSAFRVHGNANVNQAPDFVPFGLEPTVMVRPGTHDLDYKPLDLPIRSLRSRVEESDSEICATESEIEADASSSCCCYEEDDESQNLEEDNVANTCSPTPWNWPNVVKQTSYEMFGPSESESQSMNVEVENASQSMMPDLHEEPFLKEKSPSMGAVEVENLYLHVKNGSSPFSPSIPFEKDNSSRKNMESGSSIMERTTSSLKSRSMRVHFKEKTGDVSLQAGTNCQVPYLKTVSSLEFSPLCSVEAQRESTMQHSQSKSESVSPLWDFLPPSLPESSLSESPPTKEMESLQRESKKGDNLLEEMSEDRQIPSPFDQANGFPLKRVRSGKGDEMKTRTDSLRSESSCDTITPSPSSTFHNFTTPTEPKQSPDTSKSKQVEMNASEIALVLPTEASSIQLVAESDKDVIWKSRTPNSRRFSVGSIFDREMWKGSKDATKGTTRKEKDEYGGNSSGKCGWDCLKLDVKPSLTKNSLRGKSVRTVKPQEITLEPKQKSDVVIISIGISGKNNTYAVNQKQERAENCSLELGKNNEDVNEDEDCNSEIDRKAGEFIAKFKEQIRLQKVASRKH